MANPFGYSDVLMDHFDQPRNAGELASPDGVGTCPGRGGDRTTFYLRVRGGVIRNITFKCVGCPPAIAAASMTTELAKGRPLTDAAAITPDTIIAALGGLPDNKRHVATVTANALADAVNHYRAPRNIRRGDAEDTDRP